MKRAFQPFDPLMPIGPGNDWYGLLRPDGPRIWYCGLYNRSLCEVVNDAPKSDPRPLTRFCFTWDKAIPEE